MTELENLIYQQLLELYIFDLEVELLAEQLKKSQIPVPITPSPVYAPPHIQPWPYHPPWIVTCNAQTTAVR